MIVNQTKSTYNSASFQANKSVRLKQALFAKQCQVRHAGQREVTNQLGEEKNETEGMKE